MIRSVIVGLFLAFSYTPAATLQTFYSSSTFENAVGSGTFTTESFTGNQINTPGLGITVCEYYGTPQPSCAPYNAQFLTATTSIANNQVSGLVGHLNGVDWTTTFNLPGNVTAIGLDITETPSASYAPGSTLGIAVGNTGAFPFGGVAGSSAPFPGFPNPSYDYSGFVGFISDTPFNTLTFSAPVGGEVPIESIDNLTFGDPADGGSTPGDPTPEPVSFALAGVGLTGLFLFRRQRV